MPRGHYLTEGVKDAIWVLRAEGVSEAEISRRLGMPKRTVSKYLQRMGGVRPRPRRRAECCLTSAEREEISRGVARGESARAIGRVLGRSHTTISREINRCGGRRRYRAHVAERLRTAILAGDIAPGAPLVETALSQRFDVSRGPLREAISGSAGRACGN